MPPDARPGPPEPAGRPPPPPPVPYRARIRWGIGDFFWVLGAQVLAAIAAQPGEATPRLIYADWLEEHGVSPESIVFFPAHRGPLGPLGRRADDAPWADQPIDFP